jgi:hypothetical protein
MIRHIVLFKLRDGVTADDPRVVTAFGTLAALGPTLPTVRAWETHRCFGSRPVSHDFALISQFADEADLAAYAAHPEHQKVLVLLNEVFTLAVADFVL